MERSGSRYISLSWIRAKPSMDDPSNHRPWSTASLSLCAGIVTFLATPMMSVNCRLTNRTASCSTVANTAARRDSLVTEAVIVFPLGGLWAG